MNDSALRVSGLWKRFKIYSNPWARALEWVSLGRTIRHEDFWALSDVSLSAARGECLGIIGQNGAGKSTLLKIISRALHPTRGTLEVNGRLVSLLELGTGFNPQLTGIQNIYNSSLLMGFTADYVKQRLPEILEFSELGEFINRPIHIYSSGMYVRLAFSLFACLDPEIYVIDEALAVGDSSFQKKCIDRINEMRRRGVTVLFVSHDLWRVEALCDRAIYLEGGIVKDCGSPDTVIRHYLDDLEEKSAAAASLKLTADLDVQEPRAAEDLPAPLPPQYEMYANSSLRIQRLWVADADHRIRQRFQPDEDFEFVLEYTCHTPIEQPIFRVVVALPDERRVSVVGWHPGIGISLEPGRGLIRWQIKGGTLYPRKYVLHASISAPEGIVYDTQMNACDFEISAEDRGPVFRLTDDLAACLTYTVEHKA